MKIFLFFLFTNYCLLNYGQTATAYVDYNNVKALISTNGHFFNDASTTSSGYEVPKTLNFNGPKTIYTNSFWFGGEDVNGQIHVAGQNYVGDQDYWPGPLSTFGGIAGQYGDANITPGQMAYYDQIWKISNGEIQDHILNYNTPGYSPISSIANWPAHGDISLGEAYYLAPFIDINHDGNYNPMDGDYPEIRGDQTAYMILNDKGNLHSSGSEPVGLELHIMVYQFVTNDDINNTTFVNIRYINRGTQTLYNFKFSNFMDVDLGDSNDDFMGTNVDKNLVYGYNSTNVDSEFGTAPPAVGVMTLCDPIISSCYLNQLNVFSQTPYSPSSYYGFMLGQWGSSGTAFTQGGIGYGGTTPTAFLYDDFYNWSEVSENNVPGDTKFILTVNPSDNGILSPGYEGTIDLAFIYARDSTNLASVNALFDVADDVQSFFDQTYPNACEEGFLTIPKVDPETLNSISIYPNPTNGQFTIDIDGEFDLSIFDLNGKEVYKLDKENGASTINANLPNGIYMVRTFSNEQSQYQKLIVNH